MTAQKIFTALFILILLAEPLLHVANDLRSGARPEIFSLFTTAPSTEHLRDFEERIEGTSPLPQTFRPWLQAVRLLALQDAGEKALVGRADWMFYKPAVQYLVQPLPEPQLHAALEAVLEFHQQLHARGIRLIVAVAPDKASVYPEYLTATAREEEGVGHGRRFSNLLEERGVDTVDLFAHFAAAISAGADPLYLMRDTHWTPAGTDLVVNALATRLRQVPGLSFDNLTYEAVPIEVARTGDLLRMIQVPTVLAWYPDEVVTATQVLAPDTTPLKPQPESPVLLLGDSFLRMYENDAPRAAGVVANLARALGMPIAAIINDGGAANLVREELARRPGLLQGKRVVVWEFAERDLALAQGGWRKIALP